MFLLIELNFLLILFKLVDFLTFELTLTDFISSLFLCNDELASNNFSEVVIIKLKSFKALLKDSGFSLPTAWAI